MRRARQQQTRSRSKASAEPATASSLANGLRSPAGHSTHRFGDYAIQPPASTAAPVQLQAAQERPSGQHLAPAGRGKPLPPAFQTKMEGALGHDFSQVRVHEGSAAESLGAVAFTRGQDIHFAPGRYSPSSRAGQELLGHELGHVIQQRAGRVALPQGKGAPINADPALEAEADAMGRKALQGPAMPVQRRRAQLPAGAASLPVQAALWDRAWNAASYYARGAAHYLSFGYVHPPWEQQQQQLPAPTPAPRQPSAAGRSAAASTRSTARRRTGASASAASSTDEQKVAASSSASRASKSQPTPVSMPSASSTSRRAPVHGPSASPTTKKPTSASSSAVAAASPAAGSALDQDDGGGWEVKTSSKGPARAPLTAAQRAQRTLDNDEASIHQAIGRRHWITGGTFGGTVNVQTGMRASAAATLHQRIYSQYHGQSFRHSNRTYYYHVTQLNPRGKSGFRVTAHTHSDPSKSSTHGVLHVDN